MNCPLQARRCGGCTRLSVPYEKQLAFKQKKVESLFPGVPVRPIIGMKEPYHYRNKVISAFAHDRNGLISGMYASAPLMFCRPITACWKTRLPAKSSSYCGSCFRTPASRPMTRTKNRADPFCTGSLCGKNQTGSRHHRHQPAFI